MAHLRITLSGAPRVERDGILLDITVRKAVALLAYLAVTGAPQTRDALAALLWPEADQARARGALRYTLSQLKSAIGDEWLYSTRDLIGLRAGPHLTVDVAQVERLLAQVAAHGHSLQQPCALCAPLLHSLLALQHGPLMNGFSLPDSPAFDDWLFYESERLQRVQADALTALIAFHHQAGDPAAAVPYAQRLVALDPLQEKVNEHLIQLYLESDQPGAALRHYDAYARLLHDEFDAAPAPATTALLERFTAARRADVRPRLRAPVPTSDRTLPVPDTPLVGRGHEVAAIGNLLDDPTCRLLTLLGPGGSGKTRLALGVAHARQNHVDQRILFIPLAGLTAPDALAGALAAALGCPPAGSSEPQQRLVECLCEHPYLLILDNLEHLLSRVDDAPDGVLELLDLLLTNVADLQLLVTARVRLHLQQERLYPVQGLDFPEWDTQPGVEAYGAVQLFVQRARRVRPDFALTPATTSGVIQVVRLVAGQPLAIELAAAWVASMTPAEIANELVRGIDLLASAARNIPARHRSMRATYRVSWEHLRPAEQAAQQALAVFRGGFTRDAAAQVSDASPRMLQTLIDQSLLARVSDGRYELHELLRQFAAEQLAGAPQVDAQVRMRHAVYYLDRIAGQVADIVGPHGQTALRSIDQELGNLQAAWDWAVAQGDLALIYRALPNVGAYYLQRSRNQEGYAACQRVVERLDGLALTGADLLVLAQALAWQADFAIELAQLGQARSLLERSLPLLKTGEVQPVCAFVYYLLGRLSHLQGDVTQARPWLESSLALYQAQGDKVGAARVLSMLGRLTWLAGAYAESCNWYMQSLAHYRTLADPMGSIQVIGDLAMLSAITGRPEQADHLFEEATILAQSLEDPLELIKARRTIGMALANVGWNDAAAAQFEACLTLADCCEYAAMRVDNLVMLAFVRLMQGQYDQVPALSQEAFDLASRANHRRDAGFALMVLGLAELGRGEYARASEILRRCLSVYQVNNVADDQLFSLSGLSHAQRGLGDTKGARHTVMLALQTAVQSRSMRAAGIALAAYVNVLLDDQQIEFAVELEALVMNHPFAANSRFYQALNAHPVAQYAAQLPPALVAAARARGRERARLTTLDEVWNDLASHAAGMLPAQAP